MYLGYLATKKKIIILYLLDGRVFDSVGIIIVVDDLKGLNRLSSVWTGELHVQRCFSCSFGVNGEMSRLPTLHTCRKNVSLK